MNEKLDIITIGECLIELSTEESLTTASYLKKNYGGDTLTTAIAALRLGSKAGFISRIGTDCFKNFLMKSWEEEGLDVSHVKQEQGVNGLYIVSKTDECSSKEFSYYRKKTAAAKLSIEDISTDYIQNTSILYSTGITQSLSISAREAVKEAFITAKANNITTAYDPNFTSKIWSSDEAQEAFEEIVDFIDIIFLNAEYDSKVIIESASVDNIIKHLRDRGISVIIIRSSIDKGIYIAYQGKVEFLKYNDESITDLTGAGDTFNGAVLHAIASGMTPFKAAAFGKIAAGLQIKNFGAISSIPNKEEVYKIFKGQNE